MLFDEMEEELFEADDDNIEVEETISGELPQPRVQTDLIGHADIERYLLKLFSGNRHPHAIIFAGPIGIGKSTMAFRLARYLLKTSEDEYNEAAMGSGLFGDTKDPAPNLYVEAKDPVASKVASAGHPDFLTIERLYDEKKDRRKTEVSVDEIRRIAPFMRKTPAVDGGWRIVVVDDADTMNRNSQNSILKILEEPPEKSLLILITHRLGALLPTILSRASVLNFYPLEDRLLMDALGKINSSLTPDERNLVVAMAQGSLGGALLYAEQKNSDVILQSYSLLADFPKFDWTKIQLFADTLGKGATTEVQQSFQDGLLWLAQTALKTKAADSALPIPLEPYRSLYEKVSLAGWLQICDSLTEHFTRIHTGNLDKRFMVMGAYMVFENNA